MRAVSSALEHHHVGTPSKTEHVIELADLFGLLADPTRLMLLMELLDGGEVCVSDLSTRIGVGDSTVSHALRLLRASRVVRGRRDGNRIYYALIDEHVRVLVEATSSHIRDAH